MVNKYGLILFCLVSLATQAQQNQSDALKARAEALKALEGFNPASVLKGYTPNPQESSLQPQEGNNALSAQGLNAIKIIQLQVMYTLKRKEELKYALILTVLRCAMLKRFLKTRMQF